MSKFKVTQSTYPYAREITADRYDHDHNGIARFYTRNTLVASITNPLTIVRLAPADPPKKAHVVTAITILASDSPNSTKLDSERLLHEWASHHGFTLTDLKQEIVYL